ncbi:MAG: AAA family ATPase [Bacteroidota bacterium]
MEEQLVSVNGQVKELLDYLCADLYEREESMHLALLSVLAGESIFLLGPPGVGKSLIARRLKYAFKDGVSFEYLMSKFSTPDEVFGPISIKKLKEEDKYERLTDNYLPGANIVFLDEIWKAGPAIQNALLTVLNEKIYRNGEIDLQVNMRGIITASNELPPTSANLAPIWDRFLIRLEVGNIKRFDNFLSMITNTNDVYVDQIPPEIKFTNGQLDAWGKEIDQVEVPAEVLNSLQVIKVKLEEHNARGVGIPIIAHDRRWKKIIRLLRTSAFVNGRQKVDLMDCFLLKHCLWSHPSHKDTIQEILVATIADHGYSMTTNLNSLKREVQDFQDDVQREIRIPHKVTEEQLMVVDDEYFEIINGNAKFRGFYVTIKQYRGLTMGKDEVINVYDQKKNLVNKVRSQKGKGVHTILIYHDSTPNEYKLKTKLVEKEDHVIKKPHAVVRKFWDERYGELSKYVNGQLAKMDAQAPEEIKQLNTNLFVDEDLAEVVTRNFDRTRNELRELKLSLEKIQYSYTEI